MNNCKNYNSIVFLTTLSVYLGLVLAGGAVPTVLAQAATTRGFDIKNEIVIEDDLDKKPDELSEDIEIVDNFKLTNAITSFVDDLKKLESIGKFNHKEDFVFSHNLWVKVFDTTNSNSKNSNISNPWLQTAVTQLISSAGLKNLTLISDSLPNCDGENCRQANVEVESTSNEFSLSFTFTKSTPETARLCAEAFNKVFVSKKLALKNGVSLPIYENTKAISENNQVFIVTRLPRGSIDALLARTDAQ